MYMLSVIEKYFKPIPDSIRYMCRNLTSPISIKIKKIL